MSRRKPRAGGADLARPRRSGRDVHGIFLLDKPVGLGSNEALQRVKHLYQARKAGHTGSLDRLASGLLPICLGEATKLSGFLLNADKRYRSVFRLGERTTTGDAEGEVIERREVPVLDAAQVEAIAARFRGEIEQVPPMHSALKVNGQRLYKLAHQGLVVERKPRTVHIHSLEASLRDSCSVAVEVTCSKGTYIRTLAEDFGEAIGCGAHVVELRRTGSGPFDERGMHSLEDLERLVGEGLGALDALLLPLDAAVAQWPALHLLDSIAHYLNKGQPVLVPKAPTEGWVRLYRSSGAFIGMGEMLEDGRVAPRRLVRAA